MLMISFVTKKEEKNYHKIILCLLQEEFYDYYRGIFFCFTEKSKKKRLGNTCDLIELIYHIKYDWNIH